MRHHSDSDPHDALNDYLDALAGAPPPDSHAGDLDPDMRDDVDRFFDLADRAGMAPNDTRRPTMNATLPASTVLSTPKRKTRRGVTLPPWTRHLHLVSTGLLIVAIIALSFAAFGPNGIGNGDNGSNGTGDGPQLNGAVPIATVPESAETSSNPYPTADECTVEVTREDLIADLQEANVTTEPERQQYELAIEPSDEDRQAIMQTFRKWQACGWDTQGYGFAYQIPLQTPWYTANHLSIFRGPNGENLRPVSDGTIGEYVNVLLQPEEPAIPPATPGTPSWTPDVEVPKRLPVPDGSTPVALDQSGGARATIFAEDIAIAGPDTATASVYAVNPSTGEVVPSTPITVTFAKIDGQWHLDEYREGGLG